MYTPYERTFSLVFSFPNLKTPAITFVSAHTISHYLQTSVLSLNRTLSIECCPETSINLVFRSQRYFASIFYSTAYVFRIISFCFFSCILYYVACAFVICLIKYLLTYLLTYWSRDQGRKLDLAKSDEAVLRPKRAEQRGFEIVVVYRGLTSHSTHRSFRGRGVRDKDSGDDERSLPWGMIIVSYSQFLKDYITRFVYGRSANW